MPLLDPSWLPACDMRRIICHWTGGGHRASSLDRLHYHLLVEANGNVVRGEHSIADNVVTNDGRYAAHTRGCNQNSIGIAVCCMLDAEERPFHAGPAPMTDVQFHVMAQAVAELCQRYQIPVTPRTVLGHGEVQVNLGIQQNGKWDPLVLPWDRTLSHGEVGRYLRGLVQSAIDGAQESEQPPVVNVTFRGKPIGTASLMNGEVYVEAAKVATVLGCTTERSGDRIRFIGTRAPDGSFAVLPDEVAEFVSVEEVARRLGFQAEWDAAARTVRVN